jgi:hypothetical protein
MDAKQNTPVPAADSMHDLPEVAALKSQIESVHDTANAAGQSLGNAPQGAQNGSDVISVPTGDNSSQLPPTKVPGASLHPDSPVNADDGDLIEPEWVNKAKAIVERTKDNPYLQSQELNMFKADYINKRYRREIRINE